MVSPIVKATLQSAFLALCSALVATFLTPKEPPILALVVFSAFATPPNFLWQQYLERELPGYDIEKPESKGESKSAIPAGGGVNVKKRLNVKNTLLKVVIDQTAGAVINVALYLGGVRALQGVPLAECFRAIREVSNPLSFHPTAMKPAASGIA